MKKLVFLAFAALGCAQSLSDGAGIDGGPSREDSAAVDEDTGTSPADSSVANDSGTVTDTGTSTKDTGTVTVDTGTASKDTGTVVMDTAPSGPITGGPCVSGASGATAIRIRFYNGGGRPTVAYDVWGLPDKSREKVGVYGYSIPYTVPAWADPYLGEGGLQLDSSNFVDIELSTIGLSSIASATLSIYGRSYNTTASGSFNWQTFKGTGATPTNFVSNVAPYQWYGGDATVSFVPGDSGALLRIKAGPSSNSLVVNKIELCMEAS